ncbi:Structural maintenance of chromosomes protein 2 [Portunus trituberculatus]|uniref:Structural maintenance of chromosomes protein 2 n=1 Tax=Portunus trituberculatus TaxID=210409 RepID=A0A5B7G035_PORTR|nr:Structural maintenance of chromosomes protein 2 [Portunus trituberculatus]
MQVKQLLSAHEWIAEDRKFFGKPNTGYDFSANDPVEAGRRITRLEEAKTKLSKNVNMRAMNMLGKAEEQFYADLFRAHEQIHAQGGAGQDDPGNPNEM